MPVFSYYHLFGLFGRSANVTASLPYAVGNFSGSVLGNQRSIYRSGLLDFSARISVNLKGGPAMPVQQFAKWKQKILLGASLKIIAPTGQYDPTKLINWSINRWPLSRSLAIPNAGANGYLMDTEAYGSTPRTTHSSTFPLPGRKLKRPSAPLKDT